MQKLSAVLIILFCACLFTSCGLNVLRGEGNKITATPSVSTFDAVVIDVSLKAVINIKAGVRPSLQISGYENLLKHIVTKVEDNTLHIYTDLDDSWTMESDDVVATVTVPSLTDLTLNGKDDADIHGTIPGSSFSADISGAGNINIDNAAVDSFTVAVSGAGNVNIKGGTARYAEYEIDGAGDMKATALRASEASATINGTGSIALNAQQKLNASVNGAGSIIYKGNPELKRDVNGAGSITHVD